MKRILFGILVFLPVICFSSVQGEGAVCVSGAADSSVLFARFDHYNQTYAYYMVRMKLLNSPFERCYFYDEAYRLKIYIQNKAEFYNDSALFISRVNDTHRVLERLIEIFTETKNETLLKTEREKEDFVTDSPFYKDKKSSSNFRVKAPLDPIDSIIPCSTAQVACSQNVYEFPSEFNNSEYTPLAPPEVNGYPNYGCLGSQPCPTWYYMQVSQAGPIIIDIHQELTSGGGGDVDFICWGPFTSLTDGCDNGLTGTCGNPTPACCSNNAPDCMDFYPRGNIVDCSFSADPDETCHILSGLPGEFYILLITNFTTQSGMITFSQTGGTGITNCNIVVFCSLVAITATPTACDPGTNTFSVSGNLEFSNPPTTGFLRVTDNTANPPIIKNLPPPFTSPYPYTITGIPCDGLIHSLTAAFTDSTTCTLTVPDAYNAPPAVCPQAAISGGGLVCDDGVSTTTVTITFNGAPPPYDFTYDIDGIEIEILNYNGPFPYVITTKIEGTYTLVSVSNASCPGTVSGSATVTLIDLPPPPSPFAPVFFRCGPGIQSISVVDDAGILTKWYDAPVGGNLLFAGNPFVTPSISTTTTYYAESVTETGSCTSLTRTPITAEIRPEPAMTPSAQSVCSGTAPLITLSSVPAGASFTWTVTNPSGLISGFTNPGGGSQINEVLMNSSSVNPGTATYLVTPLLNQCQGSVTSYAITVNPLPVPTITPQPVPVCVNAPLSYTTEAGMTGYTWQALPDGIISPPTANTNTLQVTWPTPGNNRSVTVSYTNSYSCSAVSPTILNNITVNPLPNLIATPASPLTVCSGTPANIQFQSTVPGTELNTLFNFTANAPLTITPNPVPSGQGNISQSFSNSGSAPENVIYTISPVSNGCQSNPVSYNYTVTVDPIPVVNLVPASQVICSEETSLPVSLTSPTGGTTFSWTVNCDPGIVTCPLPGNGPTIPGSSLTNTLQTQQSVNFIVTPHFNGCNGNNSTHVINVKGRAVPTITGASSACYNVPGIPYFTEPGMVNYQWNVPGGTVTPGPTPDQITVQWTSTGPHVMSVNYEIPGGCAAISPVTKTVTVNTLPVPLLNGNTTVCTGIQTTYSTDPGMQNYIWTYTPGATVVSGGGGSDNSITLIWNSTGSKTVTVNYTVGTLCTAENPTILNITVNQSTPPVIQSPQGAVVCAGSNATYTTQSSMTDYSWEVSPGGQITSVSGTNTINVHWDVSSPPQYVRVNFTNQFLCTPDQPTEYPITVNPLPNLTIIPPAPPYCQDFPTLYSYSVASDPSCSFSWSILPAGSRIITPGSGPNEILVQWITSGNANVQVSGTYIATGCSSSSSLLPVTINPKPEVRFTPCFDQITSTSGRRFLLKGGNPSYLPSGAPFQGNYLSTPSTSALQPDGAGNFYFNPSLASPGSYSLTYRYTNQYGCPASSSPVTLTVTGANPGCGLTMTDPRDGKVYRTITIAGRCWMAENLNYGTTLGYTTPQTDNCRTDKYCKPTDPACSQGAFYQWDELVQFGNTDIPFQGVCPPGWHVPTEAEWQNMIDNFDPLFPAPSADALLGAELKDPSKSFKARLDGISYLNDGWSFTGGITATMFWTSTSSGSGKAIARGLNNPFNASISRYSSGNSNAFPVRCTKD